MSQLPKAPPTCRGFVYDHVVSVVDGPDYHPNLPPLSDDWDDSDPEENRRFEWLGDSALAIRMSLKIYEMCPGAKVEFYDLVRGILLSNDVQTHIMQKIGTPGDFPSQKSTADAFEMLVGASYTENLYHDQGMAEDFHNWFDDMFTPLVQAAEAAHRTFEQWKVDCEFARVRAGGVPLAPHIPKRKNTAKS
ncbi:hypothetical protein FB45DRAFT_515687 [Roridomyces roridus]|uniref:RNase III domain-containing protein n=1 Tax=Roridomyces roridus TaxID=1738132 RepID=A0AAD7BWZ5_9AGAR|nr:hypothetical protein FB45DRAFT_515687 [Roridomyces roridus]